MSESPESLFVEERRRYILRQLSDGGRVSVKVMSEALKVSTVTIRQDLKALEQAGLLERTYGGAVLRETKQAMPEMSFHVRMGKKQREKAAIAAVAVALVKEGYTVALDCSTTAYALVPFLKRFKKLTVVTNSLFTAQSFLDSPQVNVLMPGGRLRRDSISIVGSPEDLPDVNLNVGFFGARGISEQGGISDVDADEVLIKQAMVARCVHPVVVADGSKWGQVAPYRFMAPGEGHIITSQDAPQVLIDAFRNKDVRVDLVAVRQK